MPLSVITDDIILIETKSDPELVEIATAGPQGPAGASGINSIVSGNNIDIDITDPLNPIVSVEILTLADISDITASAVELNYVDGVTSSIQTQLDTKVKATAGALTANALVLGAGTTDTKVAAGLTTDGASKLQLGVAGTSVGSIEFRNATSGTATLSPPAGASGAISYTLPAVTSTLATLGANTFVGQQIWQSNAAATVAGIVKGATSQSAHIQEWQNNSGTVLGYFDPTRKLIVKDDTSPGTEHYLIAGEVNFGRQFGLYVAAGGNEGGFKADSQFSLKAGNSGILCVLGSSPEAMLALKKVTISSEIFPQLENINAYGISLCKDTLHYVLVRGFIRAESSSLTALRVRGVASQTAALQEWQNNSGDVLSSVDSGGSLIFGADTVSPVSRSISGQGSRTGTDTNIAGAALTIRPGKGTGNATPGALILQSYVAVASGTGAQTATTTLTLNNGVPVFPSFTVANLPAAATAGAGARAFVTDSNQTTTAGIGTNVAAGGANFNPVYCDGTNWKIG